MKIKPIVTSLKIKKLFGRYDFYSDFNELTVIVGKNGLGKTTILKIIFELITGKVKLDYPGICESIELELGNGEFICYGAINDKAIKSISKRSITEAAHYSDNIIRSINKILDENDLTNIKDKDNLVDLFISSIVNKEGFIEKAQEYVVKGLSENKDSFFVNRLKRDKLNQSINVRYISTVSISANSVNNLDIGNSVNKNILDLAINEELQFLQKKGDIKLIEGFKKQINIFLKESGKKVEFTEEQWIFKVENGEPLTIEHLSSGERQLIYILATTANTCGKPTLFLMDEPEVSLHLSWQEKIIDAIMNINPEMQIIAVTHSPGIVMNGHMDVYIEMNELLKGI
ncbi:TPA: AAA family ATPase [Morganella morganii]